MRDFVAAKPTGATMPMRSLYKQLGGLSIEELAKVRFWITEMIAEKKAAEPPKKRGRSGTRIAEAFKAIPEEPVPAEDFCHAHNISVNTLRQVKRFSKGTDKPVHVRKPYPNGVLYVWRGDKDKLDKIRETF